MAISYDVGFQFRNVYLERECMREEDGWTVVEDEYNSTQYSVTLLDHKGSRIPVSYSPSGRLLTPNMRSYIKYYRIKSEARGADVMPVIM